MGSPHPLNLHSAPWSPHSALLCAQQSLRGWRWWASGRQAGCHWQELPISTHSKIKKCRESCSKLGCNYAVETAECRERPGTGEQALNPSGDHRNPPSLPRAARMVSLWGITLPALTPGPTPHKRGSVTQDARPASPPSQSFRVQQVTRQREGLHLRTPTGQLSKRGSSCWDS